MRSIQNRHKRCIKHMNSFMRMNSFLNARLQRKLRKFSENPISGSWVSGPTIRVPGLGSRVPPMRWIPGLESHVLPTVPGLGSHLSDTPFCSRIKNLCNHCRN